jgi:hypothetical protein
MNLVSNVSKMAVGAFLLWAVSAHDSVAQTRVRTESRPATAAAGAGVESLRIRTLTGLGTRGTARTPTYTTTVSAGRAPAREWGEITVQFDSDAEWIDELAVQYFALLYSRTTKEYTLLKGAVTHIDVARGRDHLSSAYIRPSALVRYGEVTAVAVEMLSKGEILASKSDGKLPDRQVLPPDWWKNAKIVPKDGYILNRMQTPFAFINYDDYEVVK